MTPTFSSGMPPRSPLRRIAILLVAISALALLSAHELIVLDRVDRGLDHDEAQHLHIAWLVSRGLRPFVDFQEHHSPLSSLLLSRLVPSATTPEYPLLDVPTFARRARELSAVAGTLAVIAVALMTALITRRAVSGLVAAALLLGAHQFWMRGIGDVRTDPFSSLLYWVGVLILTWRSRRIPAAMACGFGAALACTAFLVNPKSPLLTMAACVWALIKLIRVTPARQRLRAMLVGIGTFLPTMAISIVAIARQTGLGPFLFNVFQFNSQTRTEWRSGPVITGGLETPFHYCAGVFHPLPVAVAALGAVLGLLVQARNHARGTWAGLLDENNRLIWFSLLLLVLAGVEVRFVLPYPRLWPQYYVFWSASAALAYGVTCSVVQDALARTKGPKLRNLGVAVPVTGCVVAAVLYFRFAVGPNPEPPLVVPRWDQISWMQRLVRPDDRVWVRGDMHPIGIHDASYYWISFRDLVPVTLSYIEKHPGQQQLPVISEQDLPPCQVLAGREDVRFFSMEGPDYDDLPSTRDCLLELAAQKRLCRTPFENVALVTRKGRSCDEMVSSLP